MPTIYKQVTPVKEVKICDECLNGEMKPNGNTTYHDRYIHKCSRCNCTREYDYKYPRIIYEEQE